MYWVCVALTVATIASIEVRPDNWSSWAVGFFASLVWGLTAWLDPSLGPRVPLSLVNVIYLAIYGRGVLRRWR